MDATDSKLAVGLKLESVPFCALSFCGECSCIPHSLKRRCARTENKATTPPARIRFLCTMFVCRKSCIHRCCFARLESSVSLRAHLSSPSWARPLYPRSFRLYFTSLALFPGLRRKAAVLCRPGCPMGRKDLFETIVVFVKLSSKS